MIEKFMSERNRKDYLFLKDQRERIIIPYARTVFRHNGHIFEGIKASSWRFKCRRIDCEQHSDAWLVTCRRIFHRSRSCVMFEFGKEPAW